MLASLPLNLACLVIAFGNGCCEISICWHHDQCHISLRCTCDHVLDEVSMSRRINDSVVPFVCVELLGGAGNGHPSLTFFLLSVHVESEGERLLAQDLSFGAKLLHGTLIDTTELENQTTSGGRLTSVDVAADND